MDIERRKFWGWGYQDYPMPDAPVQKLLNFLKFGFGIKEFDKVEPITEEKLNLPEIKFSIPENLKSYCSDEKLHRAGHSYGKSFRDVWRGMNGIFPNPPDYIAYPKSEEQITELFDFASKNNIALIPYGGGSSVTGGVEPILDGKYNGVITIDMYHFNKVLEVDKISRCARIQAGVYGLDLESQLKPHGLTLRHFPQSFEFSTLGGWIAGRAGGHYATLYTHIDEFVQSIRMVTPAGTINSRRLPGSGAGPSEERFYSGSEGIMGIITEAWMRLQEIPVYKASATIFFKSFEKGAEACRKLSQSGLNPSNARLINALEAFSNGVGDGVHAVLILGFESPQFPVDRQLDFALQICEANGGKISEKKIKSTRDEEETEASKTEAEEWKQSFIRAPYLRDSLMMYGLIVETFETAITWDKFNSFHQTIEKTFNDALEHLKIKGFITCRFTHLYTDGPAPYYTVVAKGSNSKQLEEWEYIKHVVSQAIIDNGRTTTHHHAVGRDHQPYYEQQASPVFQHILRNAKKAVDPQWILNPGVLVKKME